MNLARPPRPVSFSPAGDLSARVSASPPTHKNVEGPDHADRDGTASVVSTGGAITNNRTAGWPNEHAILTRPRALVPPPGAGVTTDGSTITR